MITRKKKEPFDVITDVIPDAHIALGEEKLAKILDQAKGVVENMQGDQLLDIAAAEPTLDRYLDRSPKLNTDQDYEDLVRILQKKRAMFITAEQKRREPKVDGEEAPQAESED